MRYPMKRLTYRGYVIHYAYMTLVIKHVEPIGFKDAYGKVEWNKAMDEEVDALDKNDTWELVELPQGKNVIGCKRVYKVMVHVHGYIVADWADSAYDRRSTSVAMLLALVVVL